MGKPEWQIERQPAWLVAAIKKTISSLPGGYAKMVKMVNVGGDSMSGTIEPGDLVFVDISVNKFDSDGIYVFGFDGKVHIKRLQMIPDKLLVISDNTRYRDWFIDEANEHRFYIFGKVMISQSQAFKRHA